MPIVHLIKLCVGVEDIDHLARLQAARLQKAAAENRPPVLRHVTRNMPRRADEVLAGGSLYWVIRGFIRVRQRIVGLEPVTDDGRPACAIILDPVLQRTSLEACRPFQGWRYLEAGRAPYDVRGEEGGAAESLPPGLAEELRQLGLL